MAEPSASMAKYTDNETIMWSWHQEFQSSLSLQQRDTMLNNSVICSQKLTSTFCLQLDNFSIQVSVLMFPKF